MIGYQENARRIRKLADGIAGRVRSVRQRWDDGDYDDNPIVEAITDIGRNAREAVDKAHGAERRIKDGYDGRDIWKLGDRFVLRMADLIDESVRVGSYGAISPSVSAEELHRMANTFRARSLSGYEAIWHISAFRKKKGRKLLDRAYEETQAQFLTEWHKFAEMFLTSDMEPMETHADPGATLMARLSDRPDATSLERTRRHELRRLVAMLREFCGSSIGYPDGYGHEGSPIPRLTEPEDGWEKEGIPLSARFWGNPDAFKGNDTVEEVGSEYVAYICDIVEATEAIEAWQEWLDGKAEGFDAEDATYASLDVLRKAGEERLFMDIENRLRRHFLSVWDWLGTAVLSIWY